MEPTDPGRAPERLPLSVGSRNLGLIVLAGERPPLTEPEGACSAALCDQLALVLERDRLLRRATEAEVYRQTERSVACSPPSPTTCGARSPRSRRR